MRTLAERLVQAREKAGLGQAEVARAIGISPGTLWRYEDGRTEPKTDRVRELAEAIGCSVEWLITGEEPSPGDAIHVDPPGLAEYLASGDGQQLVEAERLAIADMGRAIVRAGRVPSPFTYAGLVGILRTLARAPTTR